MQLPISLVVLEGILSHFNASFIAADELKAFSYRPKDFRIAISGQETLFECFDGLVDLAIHFEVLAGYVGSKFVAFSKLLIYDLDELAADGEISDDEAVVEELIVFEPVDDLVRFFHDDGLLDWLNRRFLHANYL